MPWQYIKCKVCGHRWPDFLVVDLICWVCHQAEEDE